MTAVSKSGEAEPSGLLLFPLQSADECSTSAYRFRFDPGRKVGRNRRKQGVQLHLRCSAFRSFCLKPIQEARQVKSSYIDCVNSPFPQTRFSLRTAMDWQRRGKADIIDGRLVFRDRFRTSLQRQTDNEEIEMREREQWEKEIDMERGGGADREMMVEWQVRESGSHGVYGGPKFRTWQVVRRGFPKAE